ncbi:hypothetical protein DPMN_158882 [Dreissena polymorpha]|uniref:Uncharacterized protein n=1 Tax=Dreissena polymorpha TaxID=45954 RepID=A0A9D4IQ80_DREPO|nr:hypothetical protein DPMN_158882 [Dreissena polymorpha]
MSVQVNPDKVFTLKGKSEYNVRIPRDSNTCWICGACVLSDGQVLVADSANNKVKLLNQQYQVVSHCGVAAIPRDMCLITPSEVAVTVTDGRTHEVQFITVKQSLLVLGRKFQLQHPCTGIAHDQNDLFITSGRALFKYSLSGKQVCRLFKSPRGVEWAGKNHAGFILMSLGIFFINLYKIIFVECKWVNILLQQQENSSLSLIYKHELSSILTVNT